MINKPVGCRRLRVIFIRPKPRRISKYYPEFDVERLVIIGQIQTICIRGDSLGVRRDIADVA